MSIKKDIKKDLEKLIDDGKKIISSFLSKEEKKKFNFHFEYQKWYTIAIKIVSFLAPDRFNELKSYYEIDPKRKSLGYGTYVIQDYIKGVAPNNFNHPDFDTKYQTAQNLYNQLAILESLSSRIDGVLSNAEERLYIELQDAEIDVAVKLKKINLRASGALAGVILEGYLKKVCTNRGITFSKKNITISDCNDELKNQSVYDTPTWRKISYFGDIRNICSHKKDEEPTDEHVQELLDGVNWVSKNIS